MYRNSLWLRICALLVICLSLAVLFVACDDAGDATETTGEGETTEVEETTASPGENLSIAVGGVSEFTMVAPEFPTEAEEQVFLDIRGKIAAMTGVSLPISDDWIPRGEKHNPETFEILIGKTKYDEAQSVLNETSYGSYTITAVGRKIILAAWSDKALQSGADALIQILMASLSGQDLVVPISALSATEMVDETVDSIPVVPNLTMDHVYDANGATEAIYENATIDHFNAYVAKLERDGYTKYSENERGKVSSAVLTDYKDHTLNVFYEGGYKQLCVIIEKYSKDTLPAKPKSYIDVCDTKFAQLGTEYKYGSSTPQEGMCYIWRLEDSRFVILDGGYNQKLGAENLYNTLVTMALDPDNIMIAAWVVSHLHTDHVGALLKFSSTYLSEVTIESVIVNIPADRQASKVGMNSKNWKTIKTRLVEDNPDLFVYKAHPGQIYSFANLEIEILYTLEMYAPEALANYDTASLIVDMRFGHFNMLMLGDCSEETNAIISCNYGKALESEAVQVARHGKTGGTYALYKLIDPIFVFWPSGAKQYNICLEEAIGGDDTIINTYFFKNNGTRVRKIYVGRSAVVLLTVFDTIGFTDCTVYENVTDYINGLPSSTQENP